MLDIRWLEDLIVLAEVRSFTRASELRHVTQSGLSRRIQSLEHWAGATLVDRSQSPLQLTEAGRTLLASATSVVARLNRAREAVRETSAGGGGLIKFAAPHLLSVTLFPRWMPAIRGGLGNTRFSVMSENFTGCCAALANGEVDFLVCMVDDDTTLSAGPAGASVAPDWAYLTLGEEALLPVSAPRPTGRPRHALSVGRDTPVAFLAYGPTCALRHSVDRLISARPDLPPLAAQYDNSLAEGLRSMALSGIGMAWLPAQMVGEDLARGRLVRAADSSFDVAMQIRLYCAPANLSNRAAELWARLNASSPAGVTVARTAAE